MAMSKSYRVYIGGPMTSSGSFTGNVRDGIDAANQVLNAGHIPFLPHMTMVWELVYRRAYSDWMAWDLAWLAQCEAMIRLPGESAGAEIEVTFCHQHGIPVFYSVEAFLAWSSSDERGNR
jgi:hypothetical protein